MTGYNMPAAAAILSMMIATPAFAQAAIQEPGAYAFYHPNADVLNSGRRLPAEPSGAMASVPFDIGDSHASMEGQRGGFLLRTALPLLRSGIRHFPRP